MDGKFEDESMIRDYQALMSTWLPKAVFFSTTVEIRNAVKSFMDQLTE